MAEIVRIRAPSHFQVGNTLRCRSRGSTVPPGDIGLAGRRPPGNSVGRKRRDWRAAGRLRLSAYGIPPSTARHPFFTKGNEAGMSPNGAIHGTLGSRRRASAGCGSLRTACRRSACPSAHRQADRDWRTSASPVDVLRYSSGNGCRAGSLPRNDTNARTEVGPMNPGHFVAADHHQKNGFGARIRLVIRVFAEYAQAHTAEFLRPVTFFAGLTGGHEAIACQSGRNRLRNRMEHDRQLTHAICFTGDPPAAPGHVAPHTRPWNEANSDNWQIRTHHVAACAAN